MDDILELLDNLSKFGDQFRVGDILTGMIENAKTLAIKFAKDAMIESATEAIERTDEFNRYEPLKQQLLNNLALDEHYLVGDDLASMTVFDEEIAGTEADLKAGQQAAWKSAGGTPEQRLYCWTYGIYIPFMTGEKSRKFENYPTYETIMGIRLQTWGNKAPYWIFLEYGNQGGKAFPSFPGTGFKSKVEAKIPEFLSKAHEIAATDMMAGLDSAITEQLEAPGKEINVYLGRISLGDIGGRQVQIQVTIGKRASVWYQLVIGGRFSSKITLGQLQGL